MEAYEKAFADLRRFSKRPEKYAQTIGDLYCLLRQEEDLQGPAAMPDKPMKNTSNFIKTASTKS